MIALGEVRAARYDYAGAAAIFARLVEEEPQSYVAWDLLCWAQGYLTPPRAAEAEQACRRSLQINPAHSNTHYHLTRALLLQQKMAEARRALADLDQSKKSGSMLSH